MMDWKPIETAPKDRTVCVWPPTWTDVISCARWDDDKSAKNPKPFWYRVDAFGITDSRKKPPSHWAEVPKGPGE